MVAQIALTGIDTFSKPAEVLPSQRCQDEML